MNFLFFKTVIIILLLNTLQAQPQLEWINRTGTITDSIFNSRVYFHPDHFYGPITKYKNFPYSQYENEFEIHRLKNQHESYQKLFNSIWQTGFLLQIPVKAGGQTDIISIAIVGKYNFTSNNFPLSFQKQSIDFQLMNNEADLQKLYKQATVKEPKCTDLGRVIFQLQPSEIKQPIVYLKIPNEYAESYKESVIFGLIGLELIVEFQSRPIFYTKQVEKEHFIKFKEGLNISNSLAKKKYLELYGKPLELLHLIQLKYKILGYRIVDGDHLILFEFFNDSVNPVKWSQDSLSIKESEFLIIKEKKVDGSLVPYSVNSWFHDGVVNSYKLEKDPNLIEDKFNSWWGCDLYLKLRGQRMPSLLELKEALLQFGYPGKYDIGPEITLTRGHYNDDGFVYRERIKSYVNNYGRKMEYYNDSFWNYLAKYRGIIQ